MKLNFKQLAIIYFVLLYLHITVVVYFPELESFTKPFLILLLGYWLFTHKSRFTTKGVFYATVAALVFALIGDQFMVYEEGQPLVFLGGIMSFLITHLFYIKAFSLQRNKKQPILNPFFYIIVVQGIFILSIFYEYVQDELKVPVILYVLVILAMANFASLRKHSVDDWNWKLGIIGAFSFIFSDIIIAYTHFIGPIYGSTVIVLTLYGAAQFLMVKSIIYSFETPKE